MTTTDDYYGYYDYSALDPPEHLTKALRYFFKEDCNKYKYGIAHPHYVELTKLQAMQELQDTSNEDTSDGMICQKLNVDYFDRYKKQEAWMFNQIIYLKLVEQETCEKNLSLAQGIVKLGGKVDKL